MKTLKLGVMLAIAALVCIGMISSYAGGDPKVFAVPAAEKDSGFYVGGNVGYGMTHWDKYLSGSMVENHLEDHLRTLPGISLDVDINMDAQDILVKNSKGLAWGLHVGYNFNKYIAIQAEYFHLRTAHFSEDVIADGTIIVTAGGVAVTYSILNNEGVDKVNIKSWGADLVLKLSYPIMDSGVKVYVKGGVGYLKQKSGVITMTSLGVTESFNLVDGSVFGPAFGGGLSYDINQHFAVDVGYTRLSGRTNHKSDLKKNMPDVDIIMAGLTFKF